LVPHKTLTREEVLPIHLKQPIRDVKGQFVICRQALAQERPSRPIAWHVILYRNKVLDAAQYWACSTRVFAGTPAVFWCPPDVLCEHSFLGWHRVWDGVIGWATALERWVAFGRVTRAP
jgi:hypothetical protein